jgi:fatty-acyl-CoA synthase
MPRSLIQGFEKELGVQVLHAWGMTETSPLGTVSALQSSHVNSSEDEKLDLSAKQGYPVSGIELRICSESGEELSWDGATMGEVQVRGPWVAKSYYRLDPTSEHFTEDGWFRTGDVATIDGDSFMQITDRTKDLVKSGGEWISSVALESALVAHPSIVEAAVIAIPDEQWGERPMGVVVLTKDTDSLSPDELQAFLAPQFAKFWLPEKFVFIDQIPKTSVGKYDKKVLRKRYADGQLE